MREIKLIRFTADIHHCINHPCTAEVEVLEDGEIFVRRWSDGYSDYDEVPDRIQAAIEQEVL